jgi:hypothetical protein
MQLPFFGDDVSLFGKKINTAKEYWNFSEIFFNITKI